MPTIDIDRDTAHHAAQHELDKPIYPKGSLSQQHRKSGFMRSCIALSKKGSSVPGGWFTVGMLLALLIVAVVVAVRIARRTIRTRRGSDCQLFDAGQLSAAQHRAIAERYAAEGNWTAAIRHRLRAVARGWRRVGLLDPAPGRTANELARDAGEQLPRLARNWAARQRVFNDVTYGEKPGTPSRLPDDRRSRRPSAVPFRR